MTTIGTQDWPCIKTTGRFAEENTYNDLLTILAAIQENWAHLQSELTDAAMQEHPAGEAVGVGRFTMQIGLALNMLNNFGYAYNLDGASWWAMSRWTVALLEPAPDSNLWPILFQDMDQYPNDVLVDLSFLWSRAVFLDASKKQRIPSYSESYIIGTHYCIAYDDEELPYIKWLVDPPKDGVMGPFVARYNYSKLVNILAFMPVDVVETFKVPAVAPASPADPNHYDMLHANLGRYLAMARARQSDIQTLERGLNAALGLPFAPGVETVLLADPDMVRTSTADAVQVAYAWDLTEAIVEPGDEVRPDTYLFEPICTLEGEAPNNVRVTLHEGLDETVWRPKIDDALRALLSSVAYHIEWNVTPM